MFRNYEALNGDNVETLKLCGDTGDSTTLIAEKELISEILTAVYERVCISFLALWDSKDLPM